MSRNILFLIDAHGYLHKSYHAIQNLTNSRGEDVGALFGFERFLSKLTEEKKAEYAAVCFDSPGKTFRSEIYSEYKANRRETEENLKGQLFLAPELADGLGFNSVFLEGYEADDIIASFARKFSREMSVVIITTDKDAAQLVNENVKLWDGKSPVYFDEKWVLKKYGVKPFQIMDYLAIVGDSSDNVPGARGIGQKGAQRILSEFGDLDSALKVAKNDSLLCKCEMGLRKVLEKMLAGEKNILISRQLVRLKDVPLDFKIEDLKIKEPDKKRISKLASRLEFKSLYEKASSLLDRTSVKEVALIEDVLRAREIGIFSQKDFLAVCAEGKVFTCPVSDIGSEIRETMHSLIIDEEKDKICHNLKEVMHVLNFPACNIEAKNIFDIMLAYSLLNPAERKLDFQKLLLKKFSVMFNPLGKAEESLKIVSKFPAIKSALEGELREKGLHRLYQEIELPLIKVIYFMEKSGVRVKKDILVSISGELKKRMEEIEAQIYKICACAINLNSPKQLSYLLYEKLNIPLSDKQKKMFRIKTGYSTNEEALLSMVGAHPVIGMILEHREYSKLKSSFVDNLLEIVSPEGRVHTTYEQSGTATGRFSSSRPNLQNIPIKSDYGNKIRKAFAASDGLVLLSADYSQIDLRVLAHLSGDENLVSSFRNNEDVHSKTAREVFNAENITPEMRKIAKGINFGIIYGQTSFGLARQLGIDEGRAARYIEHYFRVYSGVKAWIEKTIKFAEENGYVLTFMGRRREVPEINSKNTSVKNFARRVAVNTPVQGGSADIIKKAMIRVFERTHLQARMIMQVHDELIFEVEKKALGEVARTIAREMENAVKLNVPLKVDMKCGTNWGEMTEISL